MKAPNNVIREEFLLLTERLKLDTQFIPQDIIGTPECDPSSLDILFSKKVGEICVGPYMLDWRPLTLTLSPKGRGKDGGGRLSDRALEALVEVYKKLFLPDRQIKFIGVDLDDCLYDVTPIRHLLMQKISNALRVASGELSVKTCDSKHTTLNSQLSTQDSEFSWALYNAYKDELETEKIKKQKALAVLTTPPCSPPSTLPLSPPCEGGESGGVQGGDKGGVMAHHFSEGLAREIVKRTYQAYKNFSRLDLPEICALYKPYDGVKDTLKCLMSSGNFIVGILTNGSSRFQRNKIDLLGLQEGEHFNFVMTSEDVGVGKPFRGFFELARERASRLLCHSERSEESRCFSDEECLILEDQVKNISGADGWLKVQFLQGYHSNVQPGDVQEVPKYGIKRFSILPDLLKLEKDSELQATVAGYFILKVLLLLHG